LILVGTTALFLFIIWLTTILDFSRKMRPVRMIEYPGRGDHAAGFARDMDPPGLEDWKRSWKSRSLRPLWKR
jgi:hypothetical protein